MSINTSNSYKYREGESQKSMESSRGGAYSSSNFQGMQRQGSQANMAGGAQGFNNDESKNHDLVYKTISISN